MFIVMGDHGPRFGGTRETTQGKLEESLPFLAVHLPDWFKQKYTNEVRELEENTRVLLSPFDLHATFLHLMHFPSGVPSKDSTHGSSLFGALPKGRSCASARVPEHFCPCVVRHKVDLSHVHALEAAKSTVREINKRLRNDTDARILCRNLTLSRILGANQVTTSAKVQTFSNIQGGMGIGIGRVVFDKALANTDCSYEVKFSVSPGDGVFESTVTVNNIRMYQVLIRGCSLKRSVATKPIIYSIHKTCLLWLARCGTCGDCAAVYHSTVADCLTKCHTLSRQLNIVFYMSFVLNAQQKGILSSCPKVCSILPVRQ
ncbi:predicted protein [Nematostella vectensis]|uniref:Uncharacterized protein n=1 Tax=Nematostella vectensis TaxID=45351 RepID=A7SW42_NEMVE|nr:predicted protein [Nematostella vectensis]|eukprot:XP_001624161.1 predicted protein [Nematostella vectensis]